MQLRLRDAKCVHVCACVWGAILLFWLCLCDALGTSCGCSSRITLHSVTFFKFIALVYSSCPQLTPQTDSLPESSHWPCFHTPSLLPHHVWKQGLLFHARHLQNTQNILSDCQMRAVSADWCQERVTAHAGLMVCGLNPLALSWTDTQTWMPHSLELRSCLLKPNQEFGNGAVMFPLKSI